MRDWPQDFTLVEGRRVRGWRITCGACGATDAVHGFGFGEREAARQLPTKFARRGWHVGQRPANDRCQACINSLAEDRRNRRTSDMPKSRPEKIIAAATAAAAAVYVPIAATAPREPTRAELRRVQDAIEQHYPTPERGYAGGMTDEALAKQLGVPRDWVARVREQFYGAETDIDLSRVEAQIAALRDQWKAFEDNVINRVAEFGERHQALSRSLEQVRAQLRGAA